MSTARPEQSNALQFHGDQELGFGLEDFAVNIGQETLPDWLVNALTNIDGINQYPKTDETRKLIADFHGVSPDQVLLTGGGAEAFRLIGQGIESINPAVIHPQFTEPDAVLQARGKPAKQIIMSNLEGFHLQPCLIPETVDLVFVGNPNNPTSLLTNKNVIAQLRTPGRVVVVDEVFMDFCLDQNQTMINQNMDNLLVVRSVTKAFMIPGVRAGYLVGDPKLIKKLADYQQPWPISTQAVHVLQACFSTIGRRWLDKQMKIVRGQVKDLVTQLQTAGFTPATPADGPFVLVNTMDPKIHSKLRLNGFATRRCDTFPGLTSSWIRITARSSSQNQRVVQALKKICQASKQ